VKGLLVSVAAAAAVLSGSAVAQTEPARNGDALVYAKGTDAEVNAAIQRARDTLPVFWRKFEQRGSKGFTLKVAMPTRHGSLEHIWVDSIERRDGTIRAKLADDPDDIAGAKLGSPVVVDPGRISDWGYLVDGKLYGHFTTRVLVKRMAPGEAAAVNALLQPKPLEDDVK
jgi:uncharacterized protein YegJ (DUF2314 family)